MADNYLEKQYEAYEARKAAWEKERKYGKKKTVIHRNTTEQAADNTTGKGEHTQPASSDPTNE